MPRIWLVVAGLLVMVAVAGVGGWLLMRPPEIKRGPESPQPEPAPAAQGKLVVLVVFDQMRGDYMTRWAELYSTDGFERIKKEGVWFSDCQVPYACTSTAPGHASLSTGAPPSVHGIVENIWYDRATGKTIYSCQPKRAYDLIPPVPENLGKPGRGSALGYSPERLLAPTVSDALVEATKGKGRVFSLSIKDRTAVLMGGQKPNGVYCFDTRDGKFHTSAFYPLDAPHAWVKEFNTVKLADTWFNEKWDRLLPEEKYLKLAGPDDVKFEAPGVNGQGRTFPHPYKGKLEAPAEPYYKAVEQSPAGNEMLLNLTQMCVRAEKLGKGEAADLLCVSFSSNDLIGHFYGPDSQEMLDVTLRSDKIVGELLKFLDAEVGKDRYTLVVTADHGVCPLPELESTKAKYPAAKRVMFDGNPKENLLADLGAALVQAYGADAPALIEAFDPDTWPWVCLNHKVIAARNLKVEDVAVVVRDWFIGRAFIETAFTRAELEGAAPKPGKPFWSAAMLAYRADRCGDVIVIPKAGVLVTPYTAGTAHGSPQPYDAWIPFLAVGAGVPALGERKEKVSSLAVAPTLAWALGVPAPKDAKEEVPIKK